ncbi:hypothetical protein AVEN_90097-1 [Araneus ventricosus]|uniref:Uncharacterized protein n=1 Tax=Araneus ventricosus TaxID=182803 RepID=A0A4Y2V5C9_ARAVE|nr:hypothetical protein AVEN_90097-1 [Araneus ventricosus]
MEGSNYVSHSIKLRLRYLSMSPCLISKHDSSVAEMDIAWKEQADGVIQLNCDSRYRNVSPYLMSKHDFSIEGKDVCGRSNCDRVIQLSCDSDISQLILTPHIKT